MARCFFAIAILLVTTGCPAPTAPTAPSTNSPKRVEVTLRIVLVNDASEKGVDEAEEDAPLLRAIERLRGEWNERTGGGIEVTTVAGTDLKAVCDENDLVIFPSRWLGQLCETGQIRPMRRSTLASEALRLDDLLPLVRDVEIRYGNQVMALPFGCPTPLVLQPAGEGNSRIAVPTDDRRLALAYLAWAAPHVAHRSQLALLFDAETFAPRLATPPFIRALERFAEAVTVENTATGRIVWPERSKKDNGDWKITSPPGATESFNPIARIWEPLGTAPAKATLIASSGRLLAVTTASRNATTAFRYAAWLASAENARQISTAGNGVAICRGSFARSTDDWLGTGDREQAKQFAAATAKALRRTRWLIAPRLPGADDYLQTLGEQVRHHLQGEATTEKALSTATEAWKAISNEHGRKEQHRAYLRSINASDYKP